MVAVVTFADRNTLQPFIPLASPAATFKCSLSSRNMRLCVKYAMILKTEIVVGRF